MIPRAENGCFIKTARTRSSVAPHGDWINMVSNFNLTWKNACSEILNYVCSTVVNLFFDRRVNLLTSPSSRNALRAPSSKSEKHPWFGASGLV